MVTIATSLNTDAMNQGPNPITAEAGIAVLMTPHPVVIYIWPKCISTTHSMPLSIIDAHRKKNISSVKQVDTGCFPRYL
jgi:hypothetical protein